MNEKKAHRRQRGRPSGKEQATETIGEAVDAFLEQQGLADLSALAAIESCWTEVAGPTVASHARPKRVRGRELVVVVDQAAWVTELAFHSNRIVEALAARLGSDAIDRLNVLVGTGFGVQ